MSDLAVLPGPQPPLREWKDNEGKPIIFDGDDLNDSLLSRGPGKRDSFIIFASQVFSSVRVKNFKALLTAKDTWLGPSKPLKVFAAYDLWWDPGEQFDIAFNGAAPTGGNQTSPGRYSGSGNGWAGLYFNPIILQLFDELKAHPNVEYHPFGEGITELIPPGFRQKSAM